MSDVVIKSEALGKKYVIGHQVDNGSYMALRDVLTQNARSLWQKTRDLAQGKPIILGDSLEEFWALKDVSFEIRRGEAVGIIGRNGAGKSTLLKVLSRITEPSIGRVTIRGRVASLLEVGTGFHPELTGRENIYLNGAILGMKRTEIKHKFDEIVAFAEIEQFLDTPVKRYSSGMYVRLAFAVAAHLEPEILLVDEVLAVGDAAFQKKCLGKMGEVAKEGRTVLFVSHNMGAIRGLCVRGIWIDHGQIAMDGEVERTISHYLEDAFEKGATGQRGKRLDDEILIERVVLKDSTGTPSVIFAPGDRLSVEIHYNSTRCYDRPHFWIGVSSQFGALFGANMLFDGHCPAYVEGKGVLSCTFESLPLVPQTYTVHMGVRAQDGVTFLAPSQDVGFFTISGLMKDYGFAGELADSLSWNSTPMIVPYEWRLPNGKIIPVEGFPPRG